MLKINAEKDNIRALVPKYILEIIAKDVEHFQISKYKLCNLILLKFSLRFRSNHCQEMAFEEREYLQFTLHKENTGFYIEIRKGINGMNESEMIREIFSSYAVLPSFLREVNLFREKIAFLMSSHKEYRVLKFHTVEGIVEGRIEKIDRNKKENYLQILVNGKSYYISQIEIIS